MKVILLEEVKHLGGIGDVVNVARGYGRNYLIPLRYAVEEGKRAGAFLKVIEQKKKRLSRQKEACEELKEKLEELRLHFVRKAGNNDKLFGSVTHQHIADELSKKGFEIDKRKIREKAPLKTIGEHVVEIRLHPEVLAEVTLEIAKEE